MAEEVEGISGTVGLDNTNFKTKADEIYRQIRLVETGFRASAAAVGDWSQDATTLEARIAALNSKIELQAQLVANTRAEYEKMVEAEGADSKAAQDLEIKLNKQTETLNKMKVELGETTEALAEVEGGSEEMGDATEDAGQDVEELGDKSQNLRGVLTGLTATVKLSVAAFVAMVGILIAVAAAVGGLVFTSADAADQLAELSAQTGISTESLQEMKFAGEQLGTSLETITGSQAKLIRSMSAARDGTGAQAETFARLGVRVTDANGKLRDSQAVFGDVLDALKRIKDPTERDAAAMAIFGKSAQELNPLIDAGSEGLEKYAKQAHEMGAVVDSETIDALANFKDQVDGIKAGLQGTATTIAGVFVPAFSGVAGQVQSYLQDVARVVQESGGDLGKMATGLGKLLILGLKDVLHQAPELLQAGVDTIKSVTDGIQSFLPELLPVAVEILQQLVTFLGRGLPIMAKAAIGILNQLIQSLLPLLPLLIDAALKIIVALAEGLTDAAPTLLPAVAQVIADIAQTLVDNLPTIVLTATKLLTALAQGLTSAVKVLGPAAPVILQALIDGLLENRTELAFAAGELVGALAAFFMEEHDQLVQAMIALINILFQSLPPDMLQELGATLIAGFLTGIQNGSTQAAQTMQAQFQREWSAGLTGWQNYFSGLGKLLRSYDAQANAAWRKIFTDIGNALRDFGIQANAEWNNFFAGLGNTFSQAETNLITSWNGFLSTIVNAANGIKQSLYDTGDAFIDNLWNGISAGKDAFATSWSGFIDNIVTTANGIKQSLYDAGDAFIDNLWNGINDSWATLIASLQGLINQLPEGIRDLLGLTSGDSGEAFGESLAQGFGRSLANEVRQARAALGDFGRGNLSGAAAFAGVSSSTDNSLHLHANTIIFQGPQTQGTIAAAVKEKRY